MAPSAEALRFISSYRDAFVRKDAEAIAVHFSEPMLAYSDGSKVIFQNRHVAEAAVKGLIAIYERLGMANAEVASVDTVLREGNVEEILVEWILRGSHEEKLVSFRTSYTLVADQGQLVCLFAVSHNEMAEIRKSLHLPGGSAPVHSQAFRRAED